MENKDAKNIISFTTEATPEISPEDRLWLYWNRFKGGIIACIAAAILGLIGMQSYHYLKAARLKEVQGAFLAACTNNERPLFITTYPHSPLTGIACLEEAQLLQDKGDMAGAAHVFEQAFGPLKNSPLLGRARLGQALALALSHNTAEAITCFESIAGDKTLLDTFRAEAAYQRALLAVQAEDNEAAAHWVSQAMEMPEAGLWAHKAEMLRLVLPATGA